MSLDRNANNASRIRRNWQRMQDGRGTSLVNVDSPLLNSGSSISLTLSSTGGIESSSDALQIKLDPSSLMSLSSTGLKLADTELVALAGVTAANDRLPYFNSTTTATLATFTSFARTLLDDADAGTARTTLGLGSIATQSNANVTIIGGSISGITDLAIADGGTGASTALAARSNLGVAIGSDVQAFDPFLQDIANLVDPNADRILFYDDSAGDIVFLTVGTGLTLTDTTLSGFASPLTTKGDLHVYSTVDARLPVGTNGQILSADSAEATGLKWIDNTASSPLTTKGDIYVYAAADARLAVGADDTVLTADSSETTGLRWGFLPQVVFQNTADSSTISNTTADEFYDLTYTIPADTLAVGQVYRWITAGQESNTGSPTFKISGWLDTTGIAGFAGFTTLNNGSNRGWQMVVDIAVEAGTGSNVVLRTTSSMFLNGSGLQATVAYVQTGDIDPASAHTLKVSAQFNAASASNFSAMKFFQLYRTA